MLWKEHIYGTELVYQTQITACILIDEHSQFSISLDSDMIHFGKESSGIS